MPASPAQFTHIGRAGANSGVREVGKDPIHAETEEFEKFQAWIAAIVGSQIFPLVSESEDMHEQANLVGVGNEAGCFLRRSLRRRSLVGSAIGVGVLPRRNLERN